MQCNKATAYAPSGDGNYPNKYADQIRDLSGIDVDNKKIADLTPDEKNRLESAMKEVEYWQIGKTFEYDRQGKLVDNYIPGSKSTEAYDEDDYEDWGFTMSP